MSNNANDKNIMLSVPANKDMMLIIRLVTAGISARAKFSMDKIDDFKIAVEEASGAVMRSEKAYSSLNVGFDLLDSGLKCSVMGVNPANNEAENSDPVEKEVVSAILMSCCEQVNIGEDKGAISSVTLVKSYK